MGVHREKGLPRANNFARGLSTDGVLPCVLRFPPLPTALTSKIQVAGSQLGAPCKLLEAVANAIISILDTDVCRTPHES